MQQFTFVVAFDVTMQQLSTLQHQTNADVVFSSKYLLELPNLFDNAVVLFGEEGKNGDKNSLTECGNFTIESKSGTIKVNNGWGITF